jgi:hypothetical protein
MDFEAFEPTLAAAREIHLNESSKTVRPTLLPITVSIPSDLLTPVTVFLKLSSG